MTKIGIGVRKNADETWRECVIRYASAQGLENECLDLFDRDVKDGIPEDRAALDSLNDWDCAELFVDGEPRP